MNRKQRRALRHRGTPPPLGSTANTASTAAPSMLCVLGRQSAPPQAAVWAAPRQTALACSCSRWACRVRVKIVSSACAFASAPASAASRCYSSRAAVFASRWGTRTARRSWPDERATQIGGAYEAACEICDRRFTADRWCLNRISAKLLV
jgi:hypothetical protein